MIATFNTQRVRSRGCSPANAMLATMIAVVGISGGQVVLGSQTCIVQQCTQCAQRSSQSLPGNRDTQASAVPSNAPEASVSGVERSTGLPTNTAFAGALSSIDGLGVLFDTGDFPPRWQCGRWSAFHGWTHIIADLAIWAAYLSIPCILVYFIRRRRDVPFYRFYYLFAAFILACGTVHLIEAAIFWWPVYRVSAVAKVATAIASWTTVVALTPIIPKALALPSLKHANERLREELERRGRAEARLEQTIETSPSGMIMVDSGGAVVLVNSAAEQMFKFSRQELIGMNVDVLLPETLAPAHRVHRAGYMKRPELRAMGEGRDLFARRSDGSLFPVEIGLNPLPTENDLHVLAVIVDITSRKQKEEAVRKQNLELARRNRELDEYTYVASHDLQEPLRKLIAFSDLLIKDLGGDLNERSAKDLEFITAAASRMQTLVQDLLHLHRTGRTEADFERISLDACVDRALEALNQRIVDSGAVVQRDEMPEVICCPPLVSQLFQNLIGNAIKFQRSDHTPRVAITVERDGDDWVFGVRDNGIGFDTQYVEQIFVPFKRLHSRNEFEGSGIGLTICRKVIEQHAGRIWVESQPDKGTHFRFTLNAQISEEQPCPVSS